MHAKLLQVCPTLCDPVDHSLPGSAIHGILLARILKWVAMPFSRGSSQPRVWTCQLTLPALSGEFFTTSTTWEACILDNLYTNKKFLEDNFKTTATSKKWDKGLTKEWTRDFLLNNHWWCAYCRQSHSWSFCILSTSQILALRNKRILVVVIQI